MEEERVKKFIKAYEEIKEQSFIIANINKDFFFEFAECLIKRIKELEQKQSILDKVTDRLKEYLKAIKRDGIYGYDKEINEILNIIEGE